MMVNQPTMGPRRTLCLRRSCGPSLINFLLHQHQTCRKPPRLESTSPVCRAACWREITAALRCRRSRSSMLHQTVTCLTSHVSFVRLRRSVSPGLPAGHLKAFCHFLSGNTASFHRRPRPLKDHTEIPAGRRAAGPRFFCTLWRLFQRLTDMIKVAANTSLSAEVKVVVGVPHGEGFPHFVSSTTTSCSSVSFRDEAEVLLWGSRFM